MRCSIFRFMAAATVLFSMTMFLFAQNKGFDTKRMDTSADACDDFFQYANGTWLKSTEIPASESRWGTFNILADNNNATLLKILEEASKSKAAAGTDSQLIGDFYSSCMDEAAINKAGAKPLNPYFKQIDSIKTAEDLQRHIASMHKAGLPAVFGFGVGPDLKNSNLVIVNAGQGGLTLPNRDYYTKDDAKSLETRQKFVEYMTNIFKLLGDRPEIAAANAKIVLDIQTRLAGASLGSVEMRNPDNRYNKITFTAAQAITPNFSWAEYMSARGVPAVSEVNFVPAKFFTELNSMLTAVPIENWKTYLRWMTVNSAAPQLSKPFADANFAFFGTYLSGQKEQQPRWKTCVQATDGTLGEALGMEYVKRTFTPQAKARMDELINNLYVSMKGRINGLEWMSDATKTQAQAKLSTFKRKIGYPDVLRGYKGLTINDDLFLSNVMRARQFNVARNLNDLGKPVDRTRWNFSPPTVNASYSSTNNEITFPAGILQPPFFNSEADDAVNYGAIGGVIGHEITHGFDDSGSKFDADGNLKMWWTADDRTKFEERAACVVQQFNEYEVQPGLFIDGKLTLGENIGDFAGLTVAYDAYMKSLEGKARPADVDGLTAEQRFFLGWAQVWAGKYTPEAERLQVKTNTHSLPRWRVNGPLSNMPQFAKAFGCKEGKTMVRKNSCVLW
ncbi:MAG: M13 family metallopeptidase [Saprospiraceae bacterium]|nr:M13 family metallopeptidase [Pyrinomonadaceae bacterium]